MNATANIPSHSGEIPRLHPLLAVAAIALTVFSAVGIAALTGMLPTGRSAETPAAVPPAPTLTAAAAPQVVEKIVVVEKAEPRKPRPAVQPAKPAPMPVAQNLPAASPPAPVICLECGTVESLREVVQEGEGSGLGVVAGGVVGGLLGNQVGKGSGNTLATVLGIAGGAYAGHQIEKSQKKTLRYEISVRMTDGSLRTVTQETRPVWRAGERVRIENGVLMPDYGRTV